MQNRCTVNEKIHTLRHNHDYTIKNSRAKKNTITVTLITLATMIVEVIYGYISNSMALLTDGFHMGTHVGAFCVSIFAYHFTEKHAKSNKFSFGVWKVNVLGGFVSAVILIIVALFMAFESITKLFTTNVIQYNSAIGVAVIGLAINIVCAFILKDSHHEHGDGHTNEHQKDHNMKAAYTHVVADALTSVMAICGLIVAKYYNFPIIDPIVAIIGSIVIARWAYVLLGETTPILLDFQNHEMSEEIIKHIESIECTKVIDIHIWRIGENAYSTIICILTNNPRSPDYYKKNLLTIKDLKHIIIEVHNENA